MGQKQYSYFFMRGYFNSAEDVLAIIASLNCRHYAFIYHNKDVYTDDSENHVKGDLKKPHYHIIVNLRGARTWKALQRDVLTLFPSCGIWCHDLGSPDQALLYLTHESEKSIIDEGKHKYSRDEVRTDDYTYFCSKGASEEVKEEHLDYIQEFFIELLTTQCLDSEVVKEYAIKYGRDFILNMDRVIRSAERVLNHEIKCKEPQSEKSKND